MIIYPCSVGVMCQGHFSSKDSLAYSSLGSFRRWSRQGSSSRTRMCMSWFEEQWSDTPKDQWRGESLQRLKTMSGISSVHLIQVYPKIEHLSQARRSCLRALTLYYVPLVCLCGFVSIKTIAFLIDNTIPWSVFMGFIRYKGTRRTGMRVIPLFNVSIDLAIAGNYCRINSKKQWAICTSM